MKKTKKRADSLSRKVARTILIVSLAVLLCFTAVVTLLMLRLQQTSGTAQKAAGELIEDLSSASMQEQMTKRLMENARAWANEADYIFDVFHQAVQTMAEVTANVYNHPEDYPSRPVPLPDAANDGALSVQLLWSGQTDLDSPEIQREIGLLGNITDTLYAVNNNCAPMASNYIATASGLMVQADSISGSKFEADGTQANYEAHIRPWYIGAVETGAPFFTSPTPDYHTGRTALMLGIPIFIDGELAAVSGGGIYLDDVERTVSTAQQGQVRTACIINERGEIIFSSTESGALRAPDGDNVIRLTDSEDAALAELARSAIHRGSGLEHLSIDGEGVYVAYAPMETIGWSFLCVLAEAQVDAPTDNLLAELRHSTEFTTAQVALILENTGVLAFIALAVMIAVVLLASTWLSDRLLRPILKLTKRVRDVRGDNLEFRWDEDTRDEVQTLAESFGSLTQRIKQYILDITAITAEKERIDAELNVATQIQADMLPRVFPPFPDRHEFEIYATMTPAKEVGGDFYDFFLVDDDHLALVMADVSGKGVPAALFMVIAKTLIKTRIKNQSMAGLSPAEVLRDVNDQLCEGNEAELFVTVWLAILELSTGKGLAANAGHEHPALRRGDGKFELVVYRHSPAVATMEGTRFKEHEFQLNPGDTVFVYTDGVAEATNAQNELFGSDRLLNALNREPDAAMDRLLHNMKEDIDAFVGDAPQFDDITMLALKYFGKDGTQT